MLEQPQGRLGAGPGSAPVSQDPSGSERGLAERLQRHGVAGDAGEEPGTAAGCRAGRSAEPGEPDRVADAAPAARKLSSGYPGTPSTRGSGESLSSSQIGSSVPSGSTTMWPVTTATAGWAAKTSQARVSEPGDHQVSSSQKATRGVAATRMPRLRPGAPRLSGEATTATSGKAARTAAAVASPDPLSTTTLGQGDEQSEGAQQLLPPVVGDDHDAHLAGSGGDRRGPGRHALGYPGTAGPKRRVTGQDHTDVIICR